MGCCSIINKSTSIMKACMSSFFFLSFFLKRTEKPLSCHVCFDRCNLTPLKLIVVADLTTSTSGLWSNSWSTNNYPKNNAARVEPFCYFLYQVLDQDKVYAPKVCTCANFWPKSTTCTHNLRTPVLLLISQ